MRAFWKSRNGGSNKGHFAPLGPYPHPTLHKYIEQPLLMRHRETKRQCETKPCAYCSIVSVYIICIPIRQSDRHCESTTQTRPQTAGAYESASIRRPHQAATEDTKLLC